MTPDGATLIAGTGGGTISFRDTRTGEVLVRKAHPERVWGIAISPGGRYAVTTALKNDAALWDVAARKQLAKFATPEENVFPTPVFVDEERFVIAGLVKSNPVIAEWRVADVFHPIHARRLNLQAATCAGAGGGKWPVIALARDVPRLAVMLTNGRIVVLDWRSGQILRCAPEPYAQTSLALSPDGKRLGWITESRTVVVVDVESGREIHRASEEGDVVSLALNERGQLAVAASSVLLYDGNKQLRKCDYIADVPISLAFRGKFVFAGYRDETIGEWEVPPFVKSPQLTYAKGDFDRVAFSRDGTQLIAGVRDVDTIFDVRTSAIAGHRKNVRDVEAVSGDGSTAVVETKNLLRVIDVASNRVLKEIAIDGNYSRAALSFDGRDVAIGDSRGRVVLHHRDGEQRIMRDEDQILALAVSRRGELVAASTFSRTVVWDSRTGLSFATYPPAHGLAFSPDARLLASAHHTFLLVETLDPREWRDTAHARAPGAEAITAQRRLLSARN